MTRFRHIVLVVLLVASLGAVAQEGDSVVENAAAGRPKVGLVLGGGGAKGAAHIGVIKYMEELGIPVDYVTGTSIGSIIGGMYSVGYSADELAVLIRDMDWKMYMSNSVERKWVPIGAREHKDTYIFSVPFGAGDFKSRAKNVFLSSLPSGFIEGSSLTNLFGSLCLGYCDSMSFDQLPIPFACVATDIATGDSVVLRSGSLPLAIRSSMAIPGVFSPVFQNGRVLADGGLIDNFPSDVCKQMGADIIIGVDISDKMATSESELKSLPQQLLQYSTIAMNALGLEKQKELCDVYIHPDVEGYSALSFYAEAIDTLIRRGYEIAQQHRDELLAVKRQLEQYGEPKQPYNGRKALRLEDSPVVLSGVRYSGVEYKDREWLMIHDKLYEGQEVTKDMLEALVGRLNGSGCYTNITYSLHKTDTVEGRPRYELRVNLQRSEPHNLAVGLRVDSEESAAVLLHLGLNQFMPSGVALDVDGRINHNPKVTATALLKTRAGRSMELGYSFQNSHFGMGTRYSREYSSMTVEHNNLHLDMVTAKRENLMVRYGVEEDMFVLDDYMDRSELLLGDLAEIFTSPGHTGVFVDLDNNTFDDGYYPTRGHALEVALRWRYDTKVLMSKAESPVGYWGFAELQAHYQKVAPLGSRVCLIPQIFNRVVVGSHTSLYDNVVGGVLRGRYLDQQMPFIGMNKSQQIDNLAHIVRLDLRWNTTGSQYLTLMANYMMTADDYRNFFKSDGSYHEALGVGLRYSVNLFMGGPLSLDVHWNSMTRHLGMYFNFGYMF